ncbi:MAG: nuclear transport factor 2 family protein [Acidimicrobiales bacterium]
MSEHPNVARIIRGYEAFAAHDLDGVLGLLSDDVVWHVNGGRFAGDQKGRSEVAAHFADLAAFTGGSLLLNVLEVFADDHHAIAHVRETAARPADGATLDVREAHVFHLDPDGRATEFWSVHADPEAYRDFFA